MSYNNIGLPTPRGSGTNGYISRNLSALNPRPKIVNDRQDDRASLARKPDDRIVKHEQRRRIENECLELQVQLEEAGELSPPEIDTRVENLRKKLYAALERRSNSTQSLKDKENKKFKSLFPSKRRHPRSLHAENTENAGSSGKSIDPPVDSGWGFRASASALQGIEDGTEASREPGAPSTEPVVPRDSQDLLEFTRKSVSEEEAQNPLTDTHGRLPPRWHTQGASINLNYG